MYLDLDNLYTKKPIIPFLLGYFVFIWFAVSNFAGLLTWSME